MAADALPTPKEREVTACSNRWRPSLKMRSRRQRYQIDPDGFGIENAGAESVPVASGLAPYGESITLRPTGKYPARE